MIVVEKPIEAYQSLAVHDLQREFAGNKDGVLDDAMDGSLFGPLRDLGRALADEYGDQLRQQEAIDAFQREVNLAAARYVERHVYDKTRSLMEADQ